MTTACLTWNSPAITSEAFDDEVVIVNFDSGKYHSVQGTGRLIWQWLERPATLSAIMERSTHGFSGDREDMQREIQAFLAILQHEGLIVPVAADSVPQTAVADASASPIPFTPPRLNTFSDMQELLLLDPIHDVDEAGWPVVKENGGD